MNKMIVTKPTFDATIETNPKNMIFSSDYGTLKYYTKFSQIVTVNAGAGDIAGRVSVTHSLGYYPFAEVFVRVYIGSPGNDYEYVPFFGSGASVAYNASFILTTTAITLYGEINGVSSSIWTFDFLVFLYKNNLNL